MITGVNGLSIEDQDARLVLENSRMKLCGGGTLTLRGTIEFTGDDGDNPFCGVGQSSCCGDPDGENCCHGPDEDDAALRMLKVVGTVVVTSPSGGTGGREIIGTNRAIIANDSCRDFGDTLILTDDHTIRGKVMIATPFVNNGLVHADADTTDNGDIDALRVLCHPMGGDGEWRVDGTDAKLIVRAPVLGSADSLLKVVQGELELFQDWLTCGDVQITGGTINTAANVAIQARLDCASCD